LRKFDLTDGLHRNVSYLTECFYFHPNLNEEAVGPYPNAPNLLKCF